MWFKSIFAYRLGEDSAVFLRLPTNGTAERFRLKRFVPLLSDQKDSKGWHNPVSPFHGDTESQSSFMHGVAGNVLLSLITQTRKVPANEVRLELDKRVAELEKAENRKIGSQEKRSMRESIEFEFLPRAFPDTKRIDAWLDPRLNMLFIDASSATKAEEFTGHLRDTLTSLPVSLPTFDVAPMGHMTSWLRSGYLVLEGFTLGTECELVGQGDEKSKVSYRNHSLTGCVAIERNLDDGMLVKSLQLIWNDKIQFTLNDTGQLTKLKFLDVYDAQLDEHDPESHAEMVDIKFALMAGEIRQLISDLYAVLNAEVE